MSESKYKCDHSPGTPTKHLTLICETCLRAWIARHDKMLYFIRAIISDWECDPNHAKELLKEIDEVDNVAP